MYLLKYHVCHVQITFTSPRLHRVKIYYVKELDFLHPSPPHPTTHTQKNSHYKMTATQSPKFGLTIPSNFFFFTFNLRNYYLEKNFFNH